MEQTQFYYDTIVHAICELDMDICDNPTLDDWRDVYHSYAHTETFEWFGDTNVVNLSEKQMRRIEELLVENFG